MSSPSLDGWPKGLDLYKWPIIPKLSTAMASDIDTHLPLQMDAVSPLNNVTLDPRFIYFFPSCQPQTLVHLSLIFCHTLLQDQTPLTKKFFVDVFNWLHPSLSQTQPRILNAAYPPGHLVFVAWLILSLFFTQEMNLSWKPSVQLRKHVQNVGLLLVTGLV